MRLVRNIILFTYGIFVAFLLQGCKKDEEYNPVKKTSLAVYNFSTSFNNKYATYWLKNNDNYIWTYYGGYFGSTSFKVFDNQNTLVSKYVIPDNKLYPSSGYTSKCYSPITDKNNGNIQNAYISYTKLGADPNWTYTFLKINQIDKNANVVNEDSVFIHYSYNHDISNLKFTKTNSNYFFSYDYSSQDSCVSCGKGWFKDSLVILKTDLNLNIISRYQRAIPTNSCPNQYCQNLSNYDIQSYGSNVYLTYWNGSLSNNVLEVYDNNLNLINTILVTDLNPNWTYTYGFQKIAFTNNKLIIFGDVNEYINNKTDYFILMSFFDINGNFLSYKKIKPKAIYAEFYGFEKCNDGKFLLYYSDTYNLYGTGDFVGINKIDENGNSDYYFTFPESEASGYKPCYAYENADGTINIFASKKTNNNTGGDQTIVVRVDKEGKVQ